MQDKLNHEKHETQVPEVTQRNFILKVIGAKSSEIKNVLKTQGIKVVSLIEIHSENVSQ